MHANIALLRALVGDIKTLRARVFALEAELDWRRVADGAPCPVGDQLDVIFGDPEWGWPMVGRYTNFGPDNGGDYWAVYDQINDKYVPLDDTPPTLWKPFPKLPYAGIADEVRKGGA